MKFSGFYFIAVPNANSIGIQNLQNTLTNVTGYNKWVSDFSFFFFEQVASQNDINSHYMHR